MVGCLLVIQPDHDNIEALLRTYHTFWSTALAFLTVKRVSADVEALDRNWAQCGCLYTHNIMAAKIHSLANSMINWTTTRGQHGGLGILINHLVLTFTATINAVKTVSVAKGRHPEVWPASPKDLMPHGTTSEFGLFVLALNLLVP
jgi:hypothetical protein